MESSGQEYGFVSEVTIPDPRRPVRQYRVSDGVHRRAISLLVGRVRAAVVEAVLAPAPAPENCGAGFRRQRTARRQSGSSMRHTECLRRACRTGAMLSVREELFAGAVTCDEVAARIAVRMMRKRGADDACVKVVVEPIVPPCPNVLKSEEHDLKTTVRVGVRAPIPFPESLIIDGTLYPLNSKTDSVATFGEQSQVRVFFRKQLGFVKGVSKEVEMITSIRNGRRRVSSAEGRIHKSVARC
jgi:hypothetical protein